MASGLIPAVSQHGPGLGQSSRAAFQAYFPPTRPAVLCTRNSPTHPSLPYLSTVCTRSWPLLPVSTTTVPFSSKVLQCICPPLPPFTSLAIAHSHLWHLQLARAAASAFSPHIQPTVDSRQLPVLLCHRKRHFCCGGQRLFFLASSLLSFLLPPSLSHPHARTHYLALSGTSH